MISFSVLIITHGREELLTKCLSSLNPSSSEWELVLIANGKELSASIQEQARSLAPNFKLVELPLQVTPGKARNEGLKYCQGEWVFFLDDDAYLLKGYWDIALELLKNSHLSVFGGPDTMARGMSFFSEALAISLSSPLCTGVTFARHHSLGSGPVAANEDILTSCNLWIKRDAIHDLQFPENFLRAEETFFLKKLREKGIGMLYHPRLRVAHYRRKSAVSIFKSTFDAGYFRSSMLRQCQERLSLFWLPAIFVLLHGSLVLSPPLFLYLVKVYTGVVTFISIGIASRSHRFYLFPIVVFLHWYIVFIYGLGFLSERLRMRRGA